MRVWRVGDREGWGIGTGGFGNREYDCTIM